MSHVHVHDHCNKKNNNDKKSSCVAKEDEYDVEQRTKDDIFIY